MKHFSKILFLLVSLLILTSWQIENPKILFLTLKLEKDKQTQVENVSIINKVVVDGQFKESYVSKASGSKSALQLIFLGENKNMIQQIEIEDPMSSGIESFDIGGTMQRHFIDQNSIEFNVRVRYESSMKTLQVNKVDINKQVKNLSTLEIKL